jgi:hypothetical protein
MDGAGAIDQPDLHCHLQINLQINGGFWRTLQEASGRYPNTNN